MAYNIEKSNGDPIVVADGTADTSQFSIALLGKNTVGYGDEIAQNSIRMLENFASDGTSPSNQTNGQLWYDYSVHTLKVYNEDALDWDELMIGSSIKGDLIPDTDLAYTVGDATHRFTEMWATTFNGTATSAQYADLAERYEADAPLEAGDVVMIGGAKEVTKTTEAKSTEVFGIVSTAPGLMLNSEAGDDTTHPYIALAGRVPVKVIGPVSKGQRLVASNIAGVAMASSGLDAALAIIGRALEDKTTDEAGKIEAVVGVK
ncbi:MAG: hypothetical protein DRQ60_08705 [Gammaproteobacteria bacterium]|nr:MAG: hypothetical protein DRQ60_08705 [Gammaproteobacteria bacterium]